MGFKLHPHIDISHLYKAVKAIKAFLYKESENKKKQLIEVEDIICLVIALSMVPKRKLTPIRIPIAHPINADDTDICLIVPDKQKKNYVDKKTPKCKKDFRTFDY